MSKKVIKAQISQGGYVSIPHKVLRSQSYAKLSAHAVKLLMDLASQYRGNNNGDLTATFSIMQKFGWTSKETLNTKLKELVKAGFIELTRQGGRNSCSLYALTFVNIHYCGGKLEAQSTDYPTELWIKNEPLPDIQAAQKLKHQHDADKLIKQVMKFNKDGLNINN